MAKKAKQKQIRDEHNIGYIKPRGINQEMQESYIDYAMSVIISRALPDVRDGLKPVHRRILYTMYEDGLYFNAKFRKSATVVGASLGRYHPHGDLAVYDALVRMAQDFSLRYPLIKGQGNFGCFTGDTKIKLGDGRDLNFRELIKEQRQGKRHWAFSFNHQAKKIEMAEIKKPRLTRKKERLIEVTLDNGEKIRCTLDHRFMLQDGSYRAAKDLQEGDFLMSVVSQQTKTIFCKMAFADPQSSSITPWSGISIISNPETLSSPLVGIGKQNAVEARGVAPRRMSLTKETSSYSAPTALPLYHNHQVAKVEILNQREDVYDITVEPWHNFALAAGVFVHNSIDADPPAAQRYTECKLSKIGQEMLADIHKETVDFMDNYDGTRQEPVVLPAPPPQLLLNGALGIAVGMATNIPPHNLGEVCQAASYLIDHPKATTEELFQFIKGPDFPTAGIIYNQKEVITAYSQGKGPILMRGKADIEEKKGGAFDIIISEIPYQVNKASLVAQIAKLIQDKKIKGVKDARDESDREGIRIVLELKKGAFPKKILNRLYKSTDLQKRFHLNMIALVDGIQPKLLSLPEVLNYYLEHRKEVVVKRTKYELKRAKEREHILLGLSKCLANIDKVIATIKKSQNREEAKKKLIKGFKLTALQAEAILETKLSALAKLERQKIEDELKELKAKIKELQAILKSKAKVKTVVKKELNKLVQDYGDERRTKVYVKKVDEISAEDLVPEEEALITLTENGYIKRMSPAVYKTQKRGGKGIIGVKTRDQDFVKHFLLANTLDTLLFFTDSGKVFSLPVYELPQGSRTFKGSAIANYLEISPEERILAVLHLGRADEQKKIRYLAMATKNGIIKRTKLKDFTNIRKSGLIAIRLKKNDVLCSVKKTTGKSEIILATQKGQSVRFKEKDIRPMQRSAAGIRGISLKKDDRVIGMEVIEKDNQKDYLLVISEKGYGKKTKISQYRRQGRGGSGIKTAKLSNRTGDLVRVQILKGEEDLIIISKKGQVIRISAKNISSLGRVTQGVRIMSLAKDDKVMALISL